MAFSCPFQGRCICSSDMEATKLDRRTLLRRAVAADALGPISPAILPGCSGRVIFPTDAALESSPPSDPTFEVDVWLAGAAECELVRAWEIALSDLCRFQAGQQADQRLADIVAEGRAKKREELMQQAEDRWL